MNTTKLQIRVMQFISDTEESHKYLTLYPFGKEKIIRVMGQPLFFYLWDRKLFLS